MAGAQIAWTVELGCVLLSFGFVSCVALAAGVSRIAECLRLRIDMGPLSC